MCPLITLFGLEMERGEDDRILAPHALGSSPSVTNYTFNIVLWSLNPNKEFTLKRSECLGSIMKDAAISNRSFWFGRNHILCLYFELCNIPLNIFGNIWFDVYGCWIMTSINKDYITRKVKEDSVVATDILIILSVLRMHCLKEAM